VKNLLKQVKIEQELPFARKPTLIPAVTASQTVFKVVFMMVIAIISYKKR